MAPTITHGWLYATGGTPSAGEVPLVAPVAGYVFAGTPALGDVLLGGSNAADGGKSWLELR